MGTGMAHPFTLQPSGTLGSLVTETAETPIAGAVWYTAHAEGDGLTYRFPVGALAEARYLSADLLVEGRFLAVFHLTLREGEEGPAFHLLYGALNECSARLRMALEAVSQNRWRYPREGAWLKPMCAGQRVDLKRVDRMEVTLLRKGPEPVRWCQTGLTAGREEPPKLMESELVLPRGPLLDEMGQSTLHEWPGKTRSTDEVTRRLRGQIDAAASQRWPESFSRWGGWKEKRLEATGFFRVAQANGRWWLVDPDGFAFWSAGMDCVRVDTDAAFDGLERALTWMPDRQGEYAAAYGGGADGVRTLNYLAANCVRAFGPDGWREKWAAIALAELKRLGINTVGNWSEWTHARDAGFPYVRPLSPSFRRTPCIYRDFPDVFAPTFEEDCAEYAQQLAETAGDPALIGYFLMNEPTWGFASEAPGAGMLFTHATSATRRALAGFLRERHGTDAGLSAAWGVQVTLAEAAEGVWTQPLAEGSRPDLEAFSEQMVTRLFHGLSAACRRVDPHHLNLGVRYYTVPPDWALEGMRVFDVFSMNCYQERVPAQTVEAIASLLHMPVMVGEWHFGALDVGLPGSGIGHVRDQAARGQAYRVYVEDAAAQPACVGVHYFTLYDESALGRFDGENWNIGFLDVCNRPYEPLAAAARATHERLYQVAAGETPPYNDAPEYLPKLFL